jgi:hypothetical protein
MKPPSGFPLPGVWRVECHFTAQDEANVIQRGELTSTAHDSLEAAHLPGYWRKFHGASRVHKEGERRFRDWRSVSV